MIRFFILSGVAIIGDAAQVIADIAHETLRRAR